MAVGPDVPFSYPEVGATAGSLPAGYHHLQVERPVGSGPAAFDEAARRLLTWQMHRRAGLAVHTSQDVAAGLGVVLSIRIGLLTIAAPVRIVELIDEPRRRGFAYGTLPGHPETGEERFTVRRDDDDSVVAEIRAFSRPGRWFTRLAGPLGRRLQHTTTQRYLDALTITR